MSGENAQYWADKKYYQKTGHCPRCGVKGCMAWLPMVDWPRPSGKPDDEAGLWDFGPHTMRLRRMPGILPPPPSARTVGGVSSVYDGRV